MPRHTQACARPETIKQEQIDFWDVRYREHQQQNPPSAFEALLPPMPREAWYAGCWLHDELIAAGCGEQLAGDICFANGQVISAREGDPWVPTVQALDDYGRGKWLVPGPELAGKLFAAYGMPPRIVEAMRKDPKAFGEALREALRAGAPEMRGG